MQRLLILAIPVLSLFAQMPPPPPVGGQGPDEKDPRAIIEKVRIYLLTEKLDLSSEQAMKFFPKLNELRKIEDEFQRRRMEIIGQLEKLVADKAPDQDLAKALDSYEALMKTKAEKDKQVRDGMRELLTPVQQAKFLVFQVKFEQEIRDMIREIRENRPPRPPKE